MNYQVAHPSEHEDDRRSGDRVTTLYRPVLIMVDGLSAFCLVRNISAGGFLGMVYADFEAGQPVTVEFSEKLRVDGTLAWSQDGRIGVAFAQQIDVAAVLHELARKTIDNRASRPPRLVIECDVTIERSDQREETRMHNISQRGVEVTSSMLRPADEVFVHLEGLETRKALVRWAEGGMAGLNFVRPLEFDRLARWAIEHQSRRWSRQQDARLARPA